jgi:class 3 adenylate cyclase
MSSHVIDDALRGGREAIEGHAWREAFDLLTAADSHGSLGPADLESLAASAWWTGRLDECISARERAFSAYTEAGDRRRAAMLATALAKDYYAKGASSIGSAWVSRAERLLAEEPECIEQGHLARLHGVIAYEGLGDFDGALQHAQTALALAERFGDRDLLALALHDQGRARVAQGDVSGGMALIDEATGAAVAGDLAPYYTAVVYCNTITACEEIADYRRAGEWSDAAKRWCERQAIAGFPGMCRVYRASLMRLRGAWAEAEQEARRACDELRTFNVSYTGEAFYELGEVRLRLGDLAAAEEAFREAHELGRDPQPGLALVRLAQGKLSGACSCIESALEDEARPLQRARLLPAQVEIAIAAGDLERARAAADELERIAEAYGTDVLVAVARTERASLALAEGNVRDAVRTARNVLRLWQRTDAPYETAQARVVLGDAYLADGNQDDAVLELQAAAAAFERLGAALDARRAGEKLEALGAARRRGAATDGRSTRTFMFTDIVRSTNLIEAIGDEAWADLVRWHDATLRSIFAEHGGEEIDHAGDGFFVAFPDSSSAVECAVAIQRRLADHRRTHGFAPQVRIGLHTAQASGQGTTYKGRGVHEAARISAVAEGGEIIASRTTVESTKPRFAVSEPRPVTLTGIDRPVDVVSIDWR